MKTFIGVIDNLARYLHKTKGIANFEMTFKISSFVIMYIKIQRIAPETSSILLKFLSEANTSGSPMAILNTICVIFDYPLDVLSLTSERSNYPLDVLSLTTERLSFFFYQSRKISLQFSKPLYGYVYLLILVSLPIF